MTESPAGLLDTPKAVPLRDRGLELHSKGLSIVTEHIRGSIRIQIQLSLGPNPWHLQPICTWKEKLENVKKIKQPLFASARGGPWSVRLQVFSLPQASLSWRASVTVMAT